MRCRSFLLRFNQQSFQIQTRQFLLLSVRPSLLRCQRFSSSLSTKEQVSTKEENLVSLYQRNSERNKLPRTAFGFSLLNTTYWLWYSLDFIPAVNASPIGDLHVNPSIGFGGVALGIFINLLTGIYPSSLISKLAFDTSTQQFFVWKHDLPLIRESGEPLVYSLGSLKIDPSSAETQELLEKSSLYQGHLGVSVGGKLFPMLLEVREPSELLDPQLMLQALLDPQAMKQPTTTKTFRKKQHQLKQGRKGGKGR